MNAITVLLAEDHAIVREGLRSLLEIGREFRVVAEAATGRQAIEQARKHKPQVVVMDISMPGLNGFESTRQILSAIPATRVLILSAHSEEEYISHMFDVGASGYLVKQNSGQILLHAIREVAKGRKYFGPTVMERSLEARRKSRVRGEALPAAQPNLTPREAETLQLVAEGAANKQTAAVLGISIKTVEKHRQRLMDKLNIHDTAGLTRYAIATGVIGIAI